MDFEISRPPSQPEPPTEEVPICPISLAGIVNTLLDELSDSALTAALRRVLEVPDESWAGHASHALGHHVKLLPPP